MRTLDKTIIKAVFKNDNTDSIAWYNNQSRLERQLENLKRRLLDGSIHSDLKGGRKERYIAWLLNGSHPYIDARLLSDSRLTLYIKNYEVWYSKKSFYKDNAKDVTPDFIIKNKKQLTEARSELPKKLFILEVLPC